MANRDQQVGIEMVRRACELPCKTICYNAGEEGSVIVGQLLGGNMNTKSG